MFSRILSAGVLAATAGAAMMIMTAAPASAFTLSTSPATAPLAVSDVQPVWYDAWGRWHPNHRWRHHRHCWRGRWGRVHCGW